MEDSWLNCTQNKYTRSLKEGYRHQILTGNAWTNKQTSSARRLWREQSRKQFNGQISKKIANKWWKTTSTFKTMKTELILQISFSKPAQRLFKFMNNEEQEIVARIQEYVPDLRRHVEAQIRKELAKLKKQLIEKKSQQMRELYMGQLKERAHSMKQTIHQKQNQMRGQIERVKLEMKQSKMRALTEGEKIELMEATVSQIRSDEQMMQEIKRKLFDKVEQRVFDQMEAEMCEELEICREDFMDQCKQSHLEWEEERYDHWKAESARELQVLAEQYRELQCKKTLIQESLSTKKAERDSLLRQQKAIQQKNNEIEGLKKQIKLLA